MNARRTGQRRCVTFRPLRWLRSAGNPRWIDLPVGQPITLTAKAVWMACARTCHPGVQDLHLTLPVSAAAPAADAQWAPIFAKERAARTGSTEAWRAEVSQRDATQVTLDFHPLSPNARALTPAEVAEVIFFTDDAWIDPARKR